MTLSSTQPARLLRALAACLFIALCLAANGNVRPVAIPMPQDFSSFMIPFPWKDCGSLDRHTGLMDLWINGVLALVTAGVLLSVDGVARPKLSALAAVALFATSASARQLE